MPENIASLDQISNRYKAIICDVWGVLHNGITHSAPAAAALAEARKGGLPVVLVTNAPRPWQGVMEQIEAIGVADDAWDRIVTSGDVTRDLIRDNARQVFHLGPDRDTSLYEGLDTGLVEEFEASAVVCTGMFDDETETPEDYADMLQRLRARDLPFICANPDIVVERGDRLIWCAGALARDYTRMGGRTLIAGKPHAPIYEAALRAIRDVIGHAVLPADVLAIGDGMLTDIKGASDNGFDSLYVSGGIHAGDYGHPDSPEPRRLEAFLDQHGFWPVAVMPKLR